MTASNWLREVRLWGRIAAQPFRSSPMAAGWMVGSGRSGTTWLASLINADHTMREVFEPVHPLFFPKHHSGLDHPCPGTGDAKWQNWWEHVFSGRHITRRTDRDNLGRNPASARKLLVKDVFASGLVGALDFPDVAKVLVMRHPLAVALSKQAHRHWHWTWSPGAFLRDERLATGILLPWREALERIEQEGSELQGLIAVWAVVNRIALCSLPASDLPILHYEQAVRDPWQALSQLSDDPLWSRLISANRGEVLAQSGQVSFVSQKSTTVPGDPMRWKSKATAAMHEESNAVLDALGIGEWHTESGWPDEEAIQMWRAAQRPPLQ